MLSQPGLELLPPVPGAAGAGRQEQWAAGGSGVLGSGGRVEPAVGDCGKEDAAQTSEINTVCQDRSQTP